MKVNSKRNEGHHLPCLSGLSQTPLIGENSSERLTPISAHSLQSHQSPNRISLNQTQKPISSKPHLPNICGSSNNNAPPTLFFPPLPSKTNPVFESSICFNSNNNNHINTNDPHSKIIDFNTDVNMNVDNERNREVCNMFQQDENYHHYHEPMDPDEQQAATSVHSTFSRNPTPNMALSHAMDNHQQAPVPPTPRSNVPHQTSISEEWTSNSQASSPLITSDQRSPQFVHQDGRNSIQSSQRAAPAPFSDRSTSFCNNIAEDVYFKWVDERTSNRSRSYHGPKNIINAQTCDDQSLLSIEALNRNFGSASISEIPTSPAVFTPAAVAPLRDHCVRELIETERNYVCALEMIITCFAKPLENLLKPDDNTLIFGLIRRFHHIHSSFQNDLVKATYRLFNRDLPSLPSPTRDNIDQVSSNPTTPTLGVNKPFFTASPISSPTAPKDVPARAPRISTCFLNMKEKFLIYGEYCANLTKAQALLDELTNKNEAIAAELDLCQHNANEGKFKLRDLLSLPMQRILKYHLLLAQLIKNTSSSSDDYQGLKRAHETMVDLGQYINEVKRDTEAIQIMNEIEQSIVELNLPPDTSLIDYGRLVTDGFIRIRGPPEPKAKSSHELSKIKLPHQDTKLKQKRYVFVFDKVILICKLSGLRRYQFKDALVLSMCELDPNPTVPSDTMGRHAMKDKWNYTFNLYRSDKRTTYSFFAKTMEMKNKWVNAIQKAMDNTRPAACRNSSNMGHEFIMHKFDKPSSCDHCGKLLLGLYYQGYRCRKCFSSVHKKCLALVRACGPPLPSKSSATLAYPGYQSKSKEPPSPSVQSNHSDNGHSVFMNFPSLNTNGAQCGETSVKNEYNNLGKGRVEAAVTSSSFRENGSRATSINQRPVSSMINVSLQNSTNQLIHQNRLLRNSTSSPSISQQPTIKVKAHREFDGDEKCSEMKIAIGDIIILSGDHCSKSNAQDLIDGSMSQLAISSKVDKSKGVWLFGRNLRTGCEGRFPSHVVKTVIEQKESDELTVHSNGELMNNSGPTESYVNFSASGQPWFIDRMDRDTAQALLEEMPHGTFLVRVSPKHHNSHVISLKYNNKVMHMRIYVSKENQFYLSQNRYFNSLVELVSWYQENSLVESFNMLDARLSIPYKPR